MLKRFILLAIFILSITPAIASDSDWWGKYGDDLLVTNVEKLYRQNPDLKIASIKTKEMQEVVKMSIANELPQINFNPSIGRELRSSDVYFGNLIIPNYSQTRYLLPLAMTYEADIWGKNHLQTKSFRKLSDITLQDEKIERIYISSSFVANYFNLIKIDSLIKNQQKLVDLQKQIAQMQETKYKKGLCNRTDVIIEEETLTTFKEELNNLKSEQEVIKNQLIAMLGEKEATNIDRNSLENIKIFDVPENINSTAITKRPDFIKSELYVKKTGLDVRVARRELLPSFTLYGNIGFNAYHLDKLFTNRSFLSGVGVLPSWDVFTGGRKMANLRYKKLECKKAIEMYNKTVLTSLQELNNSLCRIKNTKSNYKESLQRCDLETEKYILTTTKLGIGATSNLDKLKEERNLYVRQNEVISQKANYLVMTIELYKALGGEDYTSLL